MTGLFVTVEGIDGAGKTTVVDAIDEEYKRVVRTQEPSELWTGKQVRRAINNETDEVHPFATFFLFMADRVHHIQKEIEPSIEDDMIVVSDRYSDSTLAYQPVALQDHLQHPRQYMEQVMHPWNLEPDLTLYIDVDIDTAINRMDGTEEYEKREFLQQVKSNYEDLVNYFSHRYVVIDGEQSKEEVRREALEVIGNHYQ